MLVYINQETPKYSYSGITELAVYPKGAKYYAYLNQYGKEKDIVEENNKIKNREEEKAERAKFNVIVDGKTVEYVKYEDGNLWYYTKWELGPEQIYKVIKARKADAIHFDSSSSENYATYIDATKCIIFKHTNTIYKIVNDELIKM